MFGLSISEVVVILLVALVVFGPERLPEVSRSVGKTLGTLRRTLDELKFSFSLADLDERPNTHRLSATTPRASTDTTAPGQTPTLSEQNIGRSFSEPVPTGAGQPLDTAARDSHEEKKGNG